MASVPAWFDTGLRVQHDVPPGARASQQRGLEAGQPRLGADFAFPSPESVLYLSTNPAAWYQQRAAEGGGVSPPVCFTTTVRSPQQQQQQQREATSHAHYVQEQQQAAHLPSMDHAAHVPSEQQPAAVSLNGNLNGNLNGQQYHGANEQFESPLNYPGASLGTPLNYPEAPASTGYNNVNDLLHVLEKKKLTQEDVAGGELNGPTDLGEGEELNACMICLDGMQAGQWATKLPCGHSFHTGCVVDWLGHRINGRLPGCCPSCNYLV